MIIMGAILLLVYGDLAVIEMKMFWGMEFEEIDIVVVSGYGCIELDCIPGMIVRVIDLYIWLSGGSHFWSPFI